MKYKIVEESSKDYLEIEINKLLREGYTLQGGICISYSQGNHKIYSQALVKLI